MKKRSLIVIILMCCLCLPYKVISQTDLIRFSQFRMCTAQVAQLDSTGGTIGPYDMVLDESYGGDYMLAAYDAEEYIQSQGFDIYMHIVQMTSNTITFRITPNATFYMRYLTIIGNNGVGVNIYQSGLHVPGPPAPYDGPSDVSEGNWIQSTKYTDPSATHFVRDISYYDGFGDLAQTINVKGSPSGGNIITPMYYDNMRRADARIYLPYVRTDTTAACDTSPFTSQSAFYQNSVYGEGTYTYYENVYEPSSLNRVIQEYNVGNIFRTADSGKYITKTYDAL